MHRNKLIIISALVLGLLLLLASPGLARRNDAAAAAAAAEAEAGIKEARRAAEAAYASEKAAEDKEAHQESLLQRVKHAFERDHVSEDTLTAAHQASADEPLQAAMRAAGLDTSAADPAPAPPSVIAATKRGLTELAEGLGLLHHEPDSVRVHGVAEQLVHAHEAAGSRGAGGSRSSSREREQPDESELTMLQRLSERLSGARRAAADKANEQYYYGTQSALTLGDRLAAFFRLRGATEPAASAAGAPGATAGGKLGSDVELQEELMKAAGMKPKTFGDRVEDSLEALHLKSKSEAKAAAEDIAAHLEHGTLHVDDVDARAKLAEALSTGGSVSDGSGFMARVLHSLGLRERSEVDKAAEAYHTALHELKVALGQEDRSMAEKINYAFSDATNSVKDATSNAYEWVKASLPAARAPSAPHPAHEPGFLEGARTKWDATTARTLASLFHARDAAAEYTDAALKKAGLRPEERSRLQKARDNLDTTMHNLMTSLGWQQPTTWERMKSYTAPSGSTGGTWDRMLKALHLREKDKSPFERAGETYYTALHKLKVSIGAEDPTAAEKMNVLLEDQRNRVNEILQSAYEHLPAVPKSGEEVSDAAKAQYYAAQSRVSDALNRLRLDTDRSLKNLGLRDKNTAEKVQDGFNQALHDLKVQLGYESPGTWESVQYATGSKPGLGGTWDRTLKALHLRDRSAYDKAGETYHTALHKLKVAVGAEDRTAGEKLSVLLEDQRNRMNEILQSAYEQLPAVPKDGKELSAAAQAQYAAAQSRLSDSLAAMRKESDKRLKELGLKDKNAVEKLHDGFNDAYHHLMVSLGMHEPTTMEKIRSRLPSFGSSASGPSTFATGSESTLGGIGSSIEDAWDRTLKTLHLRDKSATERARDAYDSALHELKVALGREDRGLTEKLGMAIDTARARAAEASAQAANMLPGGGDVTQLPEAVRDAYDSTSSRTIASLLAVRDELDGVLKHAGLKQRSSLEEARHKVHESMHSLWLALGYEEPSLFERLMARWHAAAVKLGMAEPSFGEKIQEQRVKVDALGRQAFESIEEAVGMKEKPKPGLFSRVMGGGA